jgi:hypothetical protein
VSDMDRRKTGDILWYAFQLAKMDRIAFADANGGDPSSSIVKDALADAKAFERLQKKIFGTTESKLDAALKRTRKVSLYDIKRLLREEPELFNFAKGLD